MSDHLAVTHSGDRHWRRLDHDLSRRVQFVGPGLQSGSFTALLEQRALESEPLLYLFVLASDSSRNRFPLSGPML
jgi:hypothetical protein